MAIVVSCPECQRKLKIAPTSIGKSVKCPCGNVFKAQEANEPPLAVATPVASTTLVVACDNCQAKLKVPVSARGRKMKCSKCNATFVVPAEEAPAAPPAWSEPAPPARSTPTPPAFDDDEPLDEPRAAKKSAPSRPPFFDDAEADEAAPARQSAASTPPFIEDEEAVTYVEPPPARAKGKPPARVAVAKQSAPSKAPAPASGCGGCVLSIFVMLIVVAYAAVFVPLYFFRSEIAERVDLPFQKPPSQPGKLPRLAPQPNEDGDKKDAPVDQEKEKQEKPVDKDKEKPEKPLDNDKNDNADKTSASERADVTLLQAPVPAIAISPVLDVGRPAKPGTRARTIRRAASD